jgi:pyrroline-5-carboxylate reductase
MTGITTPTIAQWIDDKERPIIRTMPNIASAVSAGMSGLFANPYAQTEEKTFAESLFRSVGTTVWVDDENQLNIITAVSGSGPAYLFYFFDAMQKTAESLGLTPEQAKLLVSQTATGAAKMVMETGETFDQLRRFVTAEKGTTAAATSVFDQHNTKMIVDEAIRAALNRAKELSR